MQRHTSKRGWPRLLATLLLAATAASLPGIATASIEYCWKDSWGRGVGTVPDSCPAGYQKEGASCYRPCPAGYKSSAIGACIQTCPSGFRDDGAFCRLAEYHVDEYPWQFGDPLNDSKMWQRCQANHPNVGCEKRGAVVVEKCRSGYSHILGFCRPSVPDCEALGFAGQFDLSCTKKSIFKELKVAQCASNEEFDAGLCYQQCNADEEGIGPVCWSKCSSNTLPFDCGAGCAENEGRCAESTIDMVVSVFESAASIGSMVATAGAAAALKTGAKVSTKAAVKIAGKQGFKQLRKGLTNVKKVPSDIWKETIKKQVKQQFVRTGKDAVTYGAEAGDVARNIISMIDTVETIEAGEASEEERDFLIAQEVLSNASIFDPTGVTGIVAAYTKPLCSVLSSGTTAGGVDRSGQKPKAGNVEVVLSDFELYKRQLVGRKFVVEASVDDAKEDLAEHNKAIQVTYREYLAPITAGKRKAQARISDLRNRISQEPTGTQRRAYLERELEAAYALNSAYGEQQRKLDTEGGLTAAQINAWQGLQRERAAKAAKLEQVQIAAAKAARDAEPEAIERSWETLQLADAVCVDESKAVALDTNYYYRLTNWAVGEGKSLGVARDNGTVTQMSVTQNDPAQFWRLTPTGDGYYRLSNQFLGTGRSLDMYATKELWEGTIMANTANLTGQSWKVTPASDGHHRLTSAWKGACKSLAAVNGQPRVVKGERVYSQGWKLSRTNVRVDTSQPAVCSGPSLSYGDTIQLVNQYQNGAGGYLDTNSKSDAKGAYLDVSTTSTLQRDSQSKTSSWIVLSPTGKTRCSAVRYGDTIRLQNAYADFGGGYLDVNGQASHSGAYLEVSTNSAPDRSAAGTATWKIWSASGIWPGGTIAADAVIRLGNQYPGSGPRDAPGGYLDTNTRSTRSGAYLDVSTTSSLDRDKGYKTSTWQVKLKRVTGSQIASALTVGDGPTYLFFKDGSYGRIAHETFTNGRVGLDAGFPQAMPGNIKNVPTAWIAGSNNVDAVMPYLTTGNYYMFKNLTDKVEYARVNGGTATISSYYPQPTPGGWNNYPSSWKTIDAAIYMATRDKIYMFSGDEYIRLSGTTVDAGYPKKIAEAFINIPANFTRDIDAATVRHGHIYFFKGDQYVRFDKGNTRGSDGYPKSIRGVWVD